MAGRERSERAFYIAPRKIKNTTMNLLLRNALSALALAFLLSGCQPDTATPGGGGGGGGSNDSHITMNVDGVPTAITPGDVYEGIVGSSGGGSWSYSSGLWNVDANVGWEIELGTIVSEWQPEPAAFTAMFAVGPRTYVDDPNFENGVRIWHLDENGDFWGTECGPQNGSTFNIATLQSITIPLQDPAVKITGTFNATLYNCTSGATMDLTNGSYTLYYQLM